MLFGEAAVRAANEVLRRSAAAVVVDQLGQPCAGTGFSCKVGNRKEKEFAVGGLGFKKQANGQRSSSTRSELKKTLARAKKAGRETS